MMLAHGVYSAASASLVRVFWYASSCSAEYEAHPIAVEERRVVRLAIGEEAVLELEQKHRDRDREVHFSRDDSRGLGASFHAHPGIALQVIFGTLPTARTRAQTPGPGIHLHGNIVFLPSHGTPQVVLSSASP